MKRWFKYIRPYLAYFIAGPLCMIVEVIGEVLMPKFLATIINLGTAWQNLPFELARAQTLVSAGGGNDYYSYFFGGRTQTYEMFEVSGGYEMIDIDVTLKILD